MLLNDRLFEYKYRISLLTWFRQPCMWAVDVTAIISWKPLAINLVGGEFSLRHAPTAYSVKRTAGPANQLNIVFTFMNTRKGAFAPQILHLHDLTFCLTTSYLWTMPQLRVCYWYEVCCVCFAFHHELSWVLFCISVGVVAPYMIRENQSAPNSVWQQILISNRELLKVSTAQKFHYTTLWLRLFASK